MKITMTTQGFKELQRELKKMSERQAKAVMQETYNSGLDIHRIAKENLYESGAWDTGGAGLAGSLMVDRVDGGKAVEVGPTAPHGPYIEFGTKPHFPPFKGRDAEGLEGWAKRHGFDSVFPICLAIAKHGTPARPYLHPAFLTVVKGFLNRLVEILKR